LLVKLIIEDDEGKTTVVPLIRDEISVGRKEGNTIRLTERNVSRRHARLIKQNGAVFIEDLNSYNGIKINGNRINGRVAVTEGDRIQIGDYILGLRMEGMVVESPAEAERQTTQPLPVAAPDDDEKTRRVKIPEPAEVPAAVPFVEPERRGSLVCVSSNFAGSRFELHKAVMVVGRTDENEIVINHRSISRHHARILEEDGLYSIMDLESANGVRVNGEEYGKVELRRGDLIDLGHVRLRFVAPGEDFDFERDAVIVDLSKVGKPRAGLYATIAVVAAAILFVVIYKSISSDDDKPQHVSGADQSVVIPRPVREDQGAAVVNGKREAEKIQAALKQGQWSTALKICDQLSDEQKAQAADDCGRARRESQADLLFEAARAAHTNNEFEKALKLFAQISKDSAAGQRLASSEDYRASRKNYSAQMLAQIDGQIRRLACDGAVRSAAALTALVSDAPNSERRIQRCRERLVARNAVKQPPDTKKPTGEKLTTVKKAPTPEEMAQANQTLSEAQDAYISGQHERAVSLARKALKLAPGNQVAHQILGTSYCYLKNAAGAKRAYRRLPAGPRRLLKSVCLQVGLTIP
jgi:pSer/pThr/pTyr-binding forkhead associated (FHA) protein